MTNDLLITYYGDDFTGSADAMEALSMSGVPTVLFLRKPTDEQRARFQHCRAIGMAGTSRSETPEWMDRHLPEAFGWLKGLGAPICHYKTCSTFDSTPEVGSIGRALDIGHAVFDQKVTPLVVGVPQMRRYTVFGNHFAAAAGGIYRLDRHPVMSVHPVTPMDEADLRIHLARQTNKTIALADFLCLRAPDTDAQLEQRLANGAEVVLFDVLDEADQREVGKQLWQRRKSPSLFVVGSSGVEYALLANWTDTNVIDGKAAFDRPEPVERLAVVSGSCSEVTERQINWAGQNGFEGIGLNVLELASDDTGETASAVAVDKALEVLKQGRSVILYTALGPTSNVVDSLVQQDEKFRHWVGQRLGQILKQIVERERLTRAVIAGGDTSSHALTQLGIYALTTRLPLPETPGSPMCCAHSEASSFDGLEIALKGGQIGTDSYFGMIRDGRAG
jgi:uncharacterized protein YgbK (DUF1537 family)